MSKVQSVRDFVNQRLTAAAEEICGLFERTIREYEDELRRQRTLLDAVLKPQVRVDGTGLSTIFLSLRSLNVLIVGSRLLQPVLPTLARQKAAVATPTKPKYYLILARTGLSYCCDHHLILFLTAQMMFFLFQGWSSRLRVPLKDVGTNQRFHTSKRNGMDRGRRTSMVHGRLK